jgi:hypothetical protein
LSAIRFQLSLTCRKKARKKRHLGHSANGCVRRRAEHPDHVWAWDFIFDRTTCGRSLKWLSIVDEYTRECLALVVARNITAERVLDVVAELFVVRDVPEQPRSDHGPELIAQALRRWLEWTNFERCTSRRGRRGRTATHREADPAKNSGPGDSKNRPGGFTASLQNRQAPMPGTFGSRSMPGTFGTSSGGLDWYRQSFTTKAFRRTWRSRSRHRSYCSGKSSPRSPAASSRRSRF